jgi:CMP-N-acetylneuraminic acid synthetase/spore coat polysaccharide biosynthesis predicted glycosyltransferase SpsG
LAHQPSVLVVIPARGGSKGIPRKNLRSLAGKPLVSYAIETALASTFGPAVVVTSDDAEILSVAQALGAIPHRRPDALGADDVTLDGVVAEALDAASVRLGSSYDVVVTLQPTSPLIRSETVDEAIRRLLADPDLDTVLSATDDTHLRWTLRDGIPTPDYTARLNRQQLPQTYRETGGVFATRAHAITPENRIGSRVAILAVDGPEAIDIDNQEHWALCEWHLGRRDVLFVVTGNHEVGLGHVHNALTVADALTRHRVRFLVDCDSELAADAIAKRHHPVVIQRQEQLEEDVRDLAPDLVINDRLDTTARYMKALKADGLVVVNFEDLGPGARLADLVINAIYPERERLPNHYFGHRYYCPRPEFVVVKPSPVRQVAQRVLVTFGGTDPGDLTERVTRVIAPIARDADVEIHAILGLGYQHPTTWAQTRNVQVHRSVDDMARQMAEADIVFTSAGRTVFEVACVGTPGIVLAQNERETTHLFASEANGFVNLGLASEVMDDEIEAAFVRLLRDPSARADMHSRMTAETLNGGLERVRLLIEGLVTA